MKFLNKIAFFHIIFVVVVSFLFASLERFSHIFEWPVPGFQVLVVFWIIWIVVIGAIQKKVPRKWIFSVIVGIPLLFVLGIVLIVGLFLNSRRGSFLPTDFPQGDLQAITQGKDVVNTTKYYESSVIPGLSSTSPDGNWKVFTEGMRYDKEMFLEHDGKKEIILHRQSKSPSYWSKIYWVSGNEYLIACVEQFTSFDGPSEKTCFAYNTTNKSTSVVADPVPISN